MIRAAMADILVSPIQKEDGKCHFFIVNDRLTPVSGKLTIELRNSERCVLRRMLKAKVAANGVKDVWSVNTQEWLKEAKLTANEAIIHAEFMPDGQSNKYANNYILVYPKDLKLQPAHIDAKVDRQPSYKEDVGQSVIHIQLTTDNYARGVFLSLDGDPDHHFSDNFFDLLPGEEYAVTVATKLSAADVERNLRVMVYR
jgi:beta-mannosidase